MFYALFSVLLIGNTKRDAASGCRTKRECMGIEPTLYSPDNTVVSNLGVSESGSIEVLELWPHLTPSQIEAILRIVREGA